MGLEVKVEVFHKERITPSSPTPHHLRNFRITIIDQFSPTFHFPVILFYPNSDAHGVNNIDSRCLVVKRTELLKRSLSKTLTRFYPFAGRIHNHASVCCNDKGAMFLEAHVNCPISRALDNPDLDFVKELVPNLQFSEGDLLLVQANFFECGGVAIGFQVSHQIIDAFTFSIFLKSWSATSRGLQIPPYQYVGAASRFPPLELFEDFEQPKIPNFAKEKLTTRRFLFECSKIQSLKSKAASSSVENPTRVEVVSALIWKCAMKASAADPSSGGPSSSAWMQTVNIRNILAEPSAENLMGNLVASSPAISMKGESADDLQGLVAAMRKGLNELKVRYGANGFGVDDISRPLKEYGEWLQKKDIECYWCTSWCRMPFYETDFGWGKPLMSPATVEIKNMTWLRDTSVGCGITATLTLKEEDMVIFENDEELLAYASLNPSVV